MHCCIPTIISIEGNIGCGKSTIIHKLIDTFKCREKEIVFLLEPVDIWEKIIDENGISILENFYTCPKKWAFAFQLIIYRTMIDQIKNTIQMHPTLKIIVCERSILSNRFVFSKMLFDNGSLNYIEHEIYNRIIDGDADSILYSPSRMIYLNVEPNICLERCIIRKRTGERNISLDYLQLCDSFHKIFITTLENNIPILNINIDIYNTDIVEKNNIASIISFIDLDVEEIKNHI
jgi:deoxyguanosine kinase